MKGNCIICGSEKNVRNYQGKQVLCGKHREQMRKHGKIRERTLADHNDFVDCGDYYEMVIYGRDCKEKAWALVDKADIWKVRGISWCVDGGGYVMSGKDSLARWLLGRQRGMEIDHLNGNKLDNRRQNLRFVSHSENVVNWHRNRRLAEGKDAESFFETL